MDRSVLMIDAGYLLLSAGSVAIDARRREDIECDYEALHRALVEYIEDQPQSPPVLRTYWYDGAPSSHLRSELTADHRFISSIRGLKLRLGRVVQGQQKGVDTLMTLDMLTLARERAAATLYLFTGDEDLCEAVKAAQMLGMRIALVGSSALEGSKQSQALIDECDEHIVVEDEFWGAFFTQREIMPRPSVEGDDYDPESNDSAYDFGVSYAIKWFEDASAAQIKTVDDRLPQLHIDVDGPLLRSAEQIFGSLREREDLRRALRTGFVDEFNSRYERADV